MKFVTVKCRGYEYKGTRTEENQGQEFISRKQLRNLWCRSCLEAWKWRKDGGGCKVKCVKCERNNTIKGRKLEEGKILCPKCRTGKKKPWWNWGVAVQPTMVKVQQSSAWIRVPKSAVRKRGGEREVRKTFKMLREVWLNIGLEKIDIHEGITVKVLLDSGTTEMFMDRKMAARHGFKLQKLDRPVAVRNVNDTNNSAGAITHWVEVNVYYKSHVERMKIDVCDLGRTEVILEMPWLQAHNPEINWETGEVRMTRCPPLCGGNKEKEEKRTRKGKRVVTLEEEKIVRWAVDDKKDWGREEKVEADHRKIEEMVQKKFLKWRKVFGKMKSKRMPIRKIWDHAIDLKETFKPRKGKIYPLSKDERKEVQKFVKDQLRKGYIRPSKSPQTSPVFFVGKKDGSKRMVMDYRNLNNQTVKNNYPLPLITDLIDNMGSKKIFTKMDLRWGFNNVRIKERDEWEYLRCMWAPLSQQSCSLE